MAQRNQERQNEYFGMTAEYNSAKNQKQRLKDAGLNPALMYGSAGSGGAGTGSNIALWKEKQYWRRLEKQRRMYLS